MQSRNVDNHQSDCSFSPSQVEFSVSVRAEQESVRESIDLKDPAVAALLAWLIPGLGHLYQGRIGKAVLFFVCIFGTFAYGCYLSGNSELGWGRAVFFSPLWEGGEKRWPYVCQIGVGLPALPAVVQWYRASHDKSVWFRGFMAPPGTGGNPAAPPSEDDLNRRLHRYFELGTVYTMIAGLLNVLAIYDAWGGPVFSEPARKEEERKAQQEGQEPELPEQPPAADNQTAGDGAPA
jgi:hypothetical protein